MSAQVGILAYGSLIPEPGAEIEAATVKTIERVETPFAIEFARRSKSRGGAPTLVPVSYGGSRVIARVFVVSVSEEEAASRLYRRETHQIGSSRSYRKPKIVGPDSVRVRRLENFADIKVVLYTDIAANLQAPTGNELARLAIDSVGKCGAGKDGVSYLIAAKRCGIDTPLLSEYEAEILRETQTGDLLEALAKLQRGPS